MWCFSGNESDKKSLRAGIAAPSAHGGGVAIFYREAKHFDVEEIHPHGLNVTRFQIVTERRRWHVVGCYLASSNASNIEDVAAVIRD